MIDGYEAGEEEEEFLMALAKLNLMKAQKMNETPVEIISIIVAPLLMPMEYLGNTEPRLKSEWKEIFRYKPAANEKTYFPLEVSFENQPRVPSLPNYFETNYLLAQQKR